jgi:hypothetical protein
MRLLQLLSFSTRNQLRFLAPSIIPKQQQVLWHRELVAYFDQQGVKASQPLMQPCPNPLTLRA